VVSGESATGNGLKPANRPLAFEPAPKEAQTFKPTGGSVPKGYHHNPLSFWRRWMALKKWLRL